MTTDKIEITKRPENQGGGYIATTTKLGQTTLTSTGKTPEEALKNFIAAEKDYKEEPINLQQYPYNKGELREAFTTIKQAVLENKEGYADSWGFNIAITCHDILLKNIKKEISTESAFTLSNEIADKFMTQFFGVKKI